MRQPIAGAAAGILYGFLLSFLSFGAAGAGHGTLIPLVLSSAPLGVLYAVADSDAERGAGLFTMLFAGPLVWMVLGGLVALASRRAALAAGLLLLHYVSGLALVATIGLTLKGIAGKIPDFALMWAPVYSIGQAVLWWRIARRRP